MENSIQKFLSNYSKMQMDKIQDFLVSEIDKENLQETIGFVKSSDIEKKGKYQDILYAGDKYEGVFIEGNQYLIGDVGNDILVIDVIGEENGMCEEQTRFNMSVENFITVISNKQEVLGWINNKA